MNKIYIAISAVVSLIVAIIIVIVAHYQLITRPNKLLTSIEVIYFAPNLPTPVFDGSKDFFDNYKYATAPADSTYESEFEEQFSSYAESVGIPASAGKYNTELYNYCDKYFTVYCGSIRVSPIYPMAVSNVETPGRANHDYTWSALFPSKYVNPDNMLTMDVTTVVSNESIFKALSTEHSTRDRGSLQMSPTYGTHDDYFNRLMSGVEKDKLAGYTNYTSWINGASDKPGDRFYLPDVLYRLSAAFNQAVELMIKNNYVPNNDAQLMVMCAMHHHRSGVWTGKANGGITWNSSDLAYEYSKLISTQQIVDSMITYVKENPDVYNINTDTAMKFIKQAVPNYSKYCSSKNVVTYPVKVLFAYTKLANLYGG